jgi:hypothetical protein
MTITATHISTAPVTWIEDEDGFTIGSHAFLAWHEAGTSTAGFTVGFHAGDVSDAYVAQTLAEVGVRYPDNDLIGEYTDMEFRCFDFDAIWTPMEPIVVSIPLD